MFYPRRRGRGGAVHEASPGPVDKTGFTKPPRPAGGRAHTHCYTVIVLNGKTIPYADTMASFWLPGRIFSEYKLLDIYMCLSVYLIERQFIYIFILTVDH